MTAATEDCLVECVRCHLCLLSKGYRPGRRYMPLTGRLSKRPRCWRRCHPGTVETHWISGRVGQVHPLLWNRSKRFSFHPCRKLVCPTGPAQMSVESALWLSVERVHASHP